MSLHEAIAAVEAAGYRVTKPRARRAVAPKLNAVGKPFSPQYDPNYRMKYRPTLAHLSKPYSDAFRASAFKTHVSNR